MPKVRKQILANMSLTMWFQSNRFVPWPREKVSCQYTISMFRKTFFGRWVALLTSLPLQITKRNRFYSCYYCVVILMDWAITKPHSIPICIHESDVVSQSIHYILYNIDINKVYCTIPTFRPGLGTVRYRCTGRYIRAYRAVYTLVYRLILYFFIL